jgi:hypothetical protein
LEPDIAEHAAFQRGVWRVQRVGWATLGLVIACAATGVTGRGGILAGQTAEASFGLVTFTRVARQGAPVEMTLSVKDGLEAQTLMLDAGFLDAFDLLAVQPAAEGQTAQGDGLSLDLRLHGTDRAIRLLARPRAAGWARYGIALGEGPPVTLKTLVLP